LLARKTISYPIFNNCKNHSPIKNRDIKYTGYNPEKTSSTTYQTLIQTEPKYLNPAQFFSQDGATVAVFNPLEVSCCSLQSADNL